jgi:hypothetical protein
MEPIDLCDSAERKMRRKRRREEDNRTRAVGIDCVGSATARHCAIEISDEEEEVEVLLAAPSGRRGRREKPSAQLESDALLAQRLHEEERRSALALPFEVYGTADEMLAGVLHSRSDWRGSGLRGVPGGAGLPPPSSAGGAYAAYREPWARMSGAGGGYGSGAPGGYGPLGGMGGVGGVGGLLDGRYYPHALGGAAPLPAGPLGGRGYLGGLGHLGGPGGGGAGAGARRQLAHLSFLDRDFGEQDYEMLLQLDEADGQEKKRHALKANAKAIESLPYKRVSKAEAKEEGTCAICLDAMRANQTVMALRCKHEYHRQCITKWLKSCETPTCPQCKAPALEGADGDPAKPSREGSPEQQWWPHT